MARTAHPNTSSQPIPGNVRGALAKRKLLDAFHARPDYQRNDYLKWIASASGTVAKQQRLDQMLDELANGKLFQGEPWTPPAPTAPATARSKS